MSGLGAFAGGLTLARRLQRRPPMPSFLAGQGLFLLGLMGLGLCRNYYAALGCMALAGFGLVTQLSTGNSLLQLNVPDELRGRLMSLFGVIVMGFAPVGSILYGVAAHYAGRRSVHHRGGLHRRAGGRGRALEEPGPAPLRLHRAGTAGLRPHPAPHYAV